MNYKTWLDNEYTLWAEALSTSTVHNFREHPQIKRMLGEIDPAPYCAKEVESAMVKHWNLLWIIKNIGYVKPQNLIEWMGHSGAQIRMICWALEVLKKNPKSICEIGGGVGEFYAILRVLGYKGEYYIYDLDPVRKFQLEFLAEVERLTGLNLELTSNSCNFCTSFYALGEFDDDLKRRYIVNVVNHCQHGFIVWNPHSGASEEINIAHDITVEDLPDGTKKITW